MKFHVVRGTAFTYEFRDLCLKFDGRKEEGVEEDVSLKQARIPDCSFAKVASTLPGPNVGRGARRKLFGQTKLSFEVMKGGAAYWSVHRPIRRDG